MFVHCYRLLVASLSPNGPITYQVGRFVHAMASRYWLCERAQCVEAPLPRLDYLTDAGTGIRVAAKIQRVDPIGAQDLRRGCDGYMGQECTE